jgi:hypothetical protein
LGILDIDFINVDMPVIFYEEVRVNVPFTSANDSQDISNQPLPEPDIFYIPDPEAFKDNPIEAKFRKLARSHRMSKTEVKPNAKFRNEINVRFPHILHQILTDVRQY